MKFYVQQLTGDRCALNMGPNKTIRDVEVVLKKRGALKEQGTRNTFIFGGKQLPEDATLQESNIRQEDLLHVVSVEDSNLAPARTNPTAVQLVEAKEEPETVFLHCATTQSNLRVLRGPRLDGKGGYGKWAQFKLFAVASARPAVQLFNVGHQAWLAVENDAFIVTEDRNKATTFTTKTLADGQIWFRCPTGGIAVTPDGTACSPSKANRGPAGRFTVIPVTSRPRRAGAITDVPARHQTEVANKLQVDNQPRKTLKLKLGQANRANQGSPTRPGVVQPKHRVRLIAEPETAPKSPLVEEITNPVGIKLFFYDNIYRFNIDGDRPMHSIKTLIRSRYEIKLHALKFSYMNDQNQWEDLSSGAELRSALKEANGKILKVKLELNESSNRGQPGTTKPNRQGKADPNAKWAKQTTEPLAPNTFVFLRGNDSYLAATPEGGLSSSTVATEQAKWQVLSRGSTVIFRNAALQKNLRIAQDGKVEMGPGFGRFVRFAPERLNNGAYLLSNTAPNEQKRNLALIQGSVRSKRGRGPRAQFTIIPAQA